MRPETYPIPVPEVDGSLTTMPRPRGGDWLEDELSWLSLDGVDIVVSLLTESESRQLGLDAEAEAAADAGIRFIAFPIPDMATPPDRPAAIALIDELATELRGGHHVAIHCRAGLGRSSVVAAGMLVRIGLSPEDALDRISRARGQTVPETDDQRRWVASLAS